MTRCLVAVALTLLAVTVWGSASSLQQHVATLKDRRVMDREQCVVGPALLALEVTGQCSALLLTYQAAWETPDRGLTP
jgi:hypothetical protein